MTADASGSPSEPRFEWSFLAPRYWGTWALFAVLRVFLYLPRSWTMVAGGYIGDQFRRRNRKRREIAEINLRLCFPELDDATREQMLVEHFRQYGRGMLDMGLVFWGSRRRVERLCRLPRRQWLEETLEKRRVIIVNYHLTTLDISGSTLALVHPGASMMKRDRNALLTWQLWKGRTHLNPDKLTLLMRDQGVRPLVRNVRRGGLGLFYPDEDFGESSYTVFAPFFGRPTSTVTTVGWLARMTRAVIVPAATRLDATTGTYTMALGEPLEDYPGDDPVEDATRLNQAMETLIRQAPEQYMWTFKFFRTQPDGAPSPYD